MPHIAVPAFITVFLDAGWCPACRGSGPWLVEYVIACRLGKVIG